MRALWNRLNNRLAGTSKLDPANKPMFDRLADIAKLQGIVEELGQAAAKLQGDARENAEAQLDSLNKQLEDHATALELGDVTGESGISARGVAKKNLAEYKAQKAIVDANEPRSDAHRKARRKMYELDGGTWTEPVWRKVYEANVERANKANAEGAAERVRLGWSNKEYAFTELGRRLDLADPASKKGAEVKAYSEGTVYNSSDIRDEVAADAKIYLVAGGGIRSSRRELRSLLVRSSIVIPALCRSAFSGALGSQSMKIQVSSHFSSLTIPRSRRDCPP